MNEYQNIDESIHFILSALETQPSTGTLKNYQNSFNFFKKYLKENSITSVNIE